MKLYFAPGSCALAPHIVLKEAGLNYSLEKVDLKTKKTETGADYLTINPKGYVPTLQLDDGSYLTEVIAVVQYLADLVPEKKLAPPAGTMERYHLIETLAFISTELHKSFSPFFNPATPEDAKVVLTKLIKNRFDLIANQLGSSEYLTNSQFTVPDAYLFVMLLWAGFVKIALTEHPNLQAFQARVGAREAVRAAMGEQGLGR